VGDVRNKRIIWVRVTEKGADGEQDLGDGECGTPLILQNVEANATIRVDVRVVDSSREVALWGLERIVRREVDVQEVNTSAVGRIVRAHDSGLPVELVLLVDGAS